MSISPGYWVLWVGAALAAAGVVLALITRRLRLTQILTPQEWRLAGQILGIIVMSVIIIYFVNGHRYDAKGFIYGRF